MQKFTISKDADQQFDAILSGQRVTIRLRFNPTTDRWTFDLSISATPKLHGRKIVAGVDLLGAFDFGVGSIFVTPYKAGTVANYENLIGGSVNLYHATESEVDAISA